MVIEQTARTNNTKNVDKIISNLEVLVCLDEFQRFVQNGSYSSQPVSEVDHMPLAKHITGNTDET